MWNDKEPRKIEPLKYGRTGNLNLLFPHFRRLWYGQFLFSDPLLTMKTTKFSSTSQEHIKWWINSIPSPPCALFSNVDDLSNGTVLVSLLCHYVHCNAIPQTETTKDSIGLIRCCLIFMAEVYGKTSLPTQLRDPEIASKRIAHNNDPETSWCLLQFLYNLHLSTQEQQRNQRRKEEMRARMHGKTFSMEGEDLKSVSTTNTGNSSCTKTTVTSVYKYPTSHCVNDSRPTSSQSTRGRSHNLSLIHI